MQNLRENTPTASVSNSAVEKSTATGAAAKFSTAFKAAAACAPEESSAAAPTAQTASVRQPASGTIYAGILRSETRNHPSWKVRVKEGISVWKPWIIDDGKMDRLKLFNQVKQDIKSTYISKGGKGANLFDKNIVDQQFVNGVLDVYAEHLTRESPKISVAFARDPKAAYDLDFDYIVHVKNDAGKRGTTRTWTVLFCGQRSMRSFGCP
jgi:hypothetical protein